MLTFSDKQKLCGWQNETLVATIFHLLDGECKEARASAVSLKLPQVYTVQCFIDNRNNWVGPPYKSFGPNNDIALEEVAYLCWRCHLNKHNKKKKKKKNKEEEEKKKNDNKAKENFSFTFRLT